MLEGIAKESEWQAPDTGLPVLETRAACWDIEATAESVALGSGCEQGWELVGQSGPAAGLLGTDSLELKSPASTFSSYCSP